jgi:hypothetical protein
MCHAIAEAHAIDEVKDIRDKARAIEMYARMALNKEAERQATEIRIRAEDRCGELYAAAVKAVGARGNPGGQGAPIVRSDDPTAQTLADLGISKQQSSDWQRLAAIPREQFEADLTDPMWRPTTAGMLERQEARERGPLPAQRVDDDALWVWGTLQDFERLLQREPEDVLGSMIEHMEGTTRRLAPLVAAWLGRIG